MLSTYIAFLKAHEKLAIVVLAGLLSFHFFGSALNAWVHHDDAQTALAQQTLVVQQQKDQVLAQQNAALIAQVAQLSAQVASIKTQRVTAQSVVAKLPDNQLQTDIEAKMGGSLSSPIVLRKIDDQITDYPLVLKQVDAQQAQIVAAQQLQVGLSDQILGLKTELTDQQKVCATQLSAEKVKTKRAFLRGLKIGFVGGFVAGIAAGHYL
jgi:hypothetical protein